MMSGNRRDYASASEWLSALKQDEAWLSQQQRLLISPATDVSIHREDAIRRIGQGETFEFWEIYGHQVEPVISEVWEIAELSLPKLKLQTIGMLSMEWLEQHAETVKCTEDALYQNELSGILASEEAMKYWQRLKEHKFVDHKFKLLKETTRQQAMYIAEAFAEKLKMTTIWKPFQDFWGIKNLAQEKWKFQQIGTMPSRYKEIDEIFKD